MVVFHWFFEEVLGRLWLWTCLVNEFPNEPKKTPGFLGEVFASCFLHIFIPFSWVTPN